MLQLFLLKTSSLFNFIFYCKCRFYIYDSWLLHYLLVLFSICYACDNPCIWKLPCEWIIFFSREILFQMLLFCQRFLPCRVLTARSCTRAAEWDIPRGCHRASLSLSRPRCSLRDANPRVGGHTGRGRLSARNTKHRQVQHPQRHRETQQFAHFVFSN